MGKKVILVVFGTRPEAIKMAPVIKELKETFKVFICVTGQQREILEQVLDCLLYTSPSPRDLSQ